MAAQRFRTEYLLWMLATVCVFVGLGFFDPTGGLAKGDHCFWAVWKSVVLQNCQDCELLLAMYAGLLAIPSAVVGWVVQAIVVVLLSGRSRSRGART